MPWGTFRTVQTKDCESRRFENKQEDIARKLGGIDNSDFFS